MRVAERDVASEGAPEGGALSRLAGLLAAAAATAEAPTAGVVEESEYEAEIKAARAKVDALYDAARNILLFLSCVPPEHPFHGAPEDICELVDENESAEKIEAARHDKLTYIDVALKLRTTFEESVSNIVADAKRRREEVRKLARERAPSKVAETTADGLEGSSAEEAILELFTGDA